MSLLYNSEEVTEIDYDVEAEHYDDECNCCYDDYYDNDNEYYYENSQQLVT